LKLYSNFQEDINHYLLQPNEVLKESAEWIVKIPDDQKIKFSTSFRTDGRTFRLWLPLISILSILFIIIGLGITIVDLIESNSDFSKLSYWVDLGKSRQFSYFQSLRLGFQCFILLFHPEYQFSTFENSLNDYISFTRVLLDGHSLLLFDMSRSSVTSSHVYESIHLPEEQQDNLGISSLGYFLMYYFYTVHDFLVELNHTYQYNFSFSTSFNNSFNLFFFSWNKLFI
jgi:hypothetical protein